MEISITSQIIKFSINDLLRWVISTPFEKIKIIHKIFRTIMFSKVHFNSLFIFFYRGLVQIYQMFKSTTGTWPMTFHYTPITLNFMALWWFSASTHYFVKPLEDKTLVHNTLWTYAFDTATARAHSKHNISVFYYIILIVGWF